MVQKVIFIIQSRYVVVIQGDGDTYFTISSLKLLTYFESYSILMYLSMIHVTGNACCIQFRRFMTGRKVLLETSSRKHQN